MLTFSKRAYTALNIRIGRLGLSGLVACLLAISLTGCSTDVPAPEPATITFAHPAVDTEYYEPLLQEFNESHAYITVESSPQPWNVMDDLDAEDADVYVASVFVLMQMWAQGYILSVDPFIEQGGSLETSDFYPGTIELLSSEGKTWAIPAGVDLNVMYYNKDLFDQHSLPYPEPPWTWDDCLNYALAISDPDAGIYGYATTLSYPDALLFIYQYGGQIVDDLEDPDHTTFDDPLTIEALEWYARLFHEYEVAPTLSQARKTFGGGQYAIYDGIRHGNIGLWILALSERDGLTWQVEWFVNWGIAPLPSGARPVTDAWVEGYAISSETPHTDACWEWILFLSDQMPHRLMPPRRSLAESKTYEQLVGEDVAAAARASMKNAVLISPNAWAEFGPALEIFEEAIGAIVEGNATPEEAMDQAQQRAGAVNP